MREKNESAWNDAFLSAPPPRKAQRLLGVTFNPSMLKDEPERHSFHPGSLYATTEPCKLQDIPAECRSIVGHEPTAALLSAVLGRPIPFNRETVTLDSGDLLYAVIPQFRVEVAREFTAEELSSAKFRCFRVSVKRWSIY